VSAGYEIYRSLHNPSHHVAVRAGDSGEVASSVRTSQNLAFLTRVSGEGDPRIAFDAAEADMRIARDGFYAFAVSVHAREHAH